MDKVSTIGLDIAKNVFQVHGIDVTGQVVIRRQVRRRQVFEPRRVCRRLFCLSHTTIARPWLSA